MTDIQIKCLQTQEVLEGLLLHAVLGPLKCSVYLRLTELENKSVYTLSEWLHSKVGQKPAVLAASHYLHSLSPRTMWPHVSVYM